MSNSKLQALVEKQVGPGGVHNIVLGVHAHDGRIDFTGAAGVADPDSGAPMTADTPYFLASITKMYTAAVILRLHQLGQLDLDEAISNYLPDALTEGIHVVAGKDLGGQLKVHQLLAQTSGLADYFEGKPRGGRSLFEDLKDGRDRRLDLEQMLAIVRGLEPSFKPGTRAHYSDTNYQLLGAVIEAVTGGSLAHAYRQLIFEPLGLTRTYLYDAEQPRHDTAPATIYHRDRPLAIRGFLSSAGPDGGLVSTVAESLAFVRGFFAGELFDRGLFERMMDWQAIFFPIEYGYGMMRFKLPRLLSPFRPSPEFIGHSGSTGSFAFWQPERELYLAGTVNQTAAPSRPYRLLTQVLGVLG